MTLKEKALNSNSNNPGVPRLGIPNMKFSEALHGVLSDCGEPAPNQKDNSNSTCCISGLRGPYSSLA